MNKKINSPFTLPCGVVLKNRLAKAAMTERISDSHFQPTSEHNVLYEKWSESEAALLVTGNVLVDRKHLESAGNVIFDEYSDVERLKSWARSATKNGNQCWVQISHSGRQTNKFVNAHPLAPSVVPLKKMGMFGKPKEMKESDIKSVISGFVRTAEMAKNVGFTGVQIHAAHGYLLSQFLSPHTNRRTDSWGGNLENRSRLLRTIVENVRESVGESFPISVKINSSDFQRGGFEESESLQVVEMLSSLGVDLLEISGGTYEKVAFFLAQENKDKIRESTRKREAYFIDFARKVRDKVSTPLMLTGGFRSREACENVLENGEVDIIGMGRPFLTNLPQIPAFLQGELDELESLDLKTGFKSLDDSAEAGYYAKQIVQIAGGKALKSDFSPIKASVFLIIHELKKSLEKRRNRS